MTRRKADPPGDAEKPEGTPAARDGSPDEDELARRREAKAGTSVADRVQNSDPDDDELFPVGVVEGDSKITLKNLIKPGQRVTLKASLSSAEVPLTGGLLHPEQEVTLLVRGLPGAPVPVAKHRDAQAGGDHTIEEFTLRQPIRAMHVENAGEMYSRVQVLDLLHEAGVSSATVSKLLGDGPEVAEA
jgi:hypothetical protein